MSAESLETIYLTEEEYLALEERSSIKHEYLGGVVYAMGGGSSSHDILQNNLSVALTLQLRGSGCRPCGPDYALRLPARSSSKPYYYYPDKMISCDATDRRKTWMEKPTVIFEVISESTRQIDEREKRAAYLQIESLQAYVRIEQDEVSALVEYRTAEGWRQVQVKGLDAVIRLSSPQVELAMAQLYEDVPLTREE